MAKVFTEPVSRPTQTQSPPSLARGKIQQEKAERAHKRASHRAKLGAGELGAEVQGRVVAHFGSQAEVELLGASYEQAVRYRCFARQFRLFGDRR